VSWNEDNIDDQVEARAKEQRTVVGIILSIEDDLTRVLREKEDESESQLPSSKLAEKGEGTGLATHPFRLLRIHISEEDISVDSSISLSKVRDGFLSIREESRWSDRARDTRSPREEKRFEGSRGK